jgi:hypothetical protein
LPRFCAPDSSRSPWCGRWDGDIWTVLLLSCQTWGMPSMLGLHLASASVRLQVQLGHCVRITRPEHRPSQDNSYVFLLSTASFDARLCEHSLCKVCGFTRFVEQVPPANQEAHEGRSRDQISVLLVWRVSPAREPHHNSWLFHLCTSQASNL